MLRRLAGFLCFGMAALLFVVLANRLYVIWERFGDDRAWDALVAYTEKAGPQVGAPFSLDPPCTFDPPTAATPTWSQAE